MEKMYSYRFLILLLFASSCKAGPLILAIVPLVETISEAAATAIASSAISSAFGITSCGVMFSEATVVNGALFYGTTAAAYGVLAGGAAAGVGAGVAAGVDAHGKAVTDAAISNSIMSYRSSVSVASVASVASVSSQSVASVSAASRWSVESKEATSAAYQTWLSLKASMDAHASTTPRSTKSAWDFDALLASFTKTMADNKAVKSSTPSPTVQPSKQVVTSAPISSVLLSSAVPRSTALPLYRPPGVPTGVPDYVFRMCQDDITKMGRNKVSLLFDQPGPQSIRVDNIPSTCMTLSTVITGNPELGPHPVPMGSGSLQWNDIHPDTINLIRMAFGQPNQTASTH